MKTLHVCWSNGDDSKISVTEEVAQQIRENEWNGLTISGSSGGWNLAHAREIFIED